MSLMEAAIRRRIGTSLLAAGTLLIGIIAYGALPVAPLPQVEFPTIQIVTALPGASADTMATSVATPLERSFSTIPGVTQMTSSNSLGLSQIVLQFDLNRSIDGVAQDVQSAISAAGGLLPKNLPNSPAYEEVNPADFTLLSLALTSDTMPLTDVDRYAEDFIAQQISQMPGVGLVDFHGQLRPSVRLQIDPDKLTGLGLSFEDIRSVITVATVNAPKGSLNGANQAVVLNATDQLLNADAYADLIIAYKAGAPVRVRDVGIAVDAPENLRQAAWLQDKRAIIIDIHKQPGFNVINTIRSIKDRLPELTASLPAAAKIQIVGDRTQTIEASINDVRLTMLITIALVVLVIIAFLRSFWATVIPAMTIPLSLIATFAVMYCLGYSLDNLSLMGLTVAVGFVVDDAIVVIENVIRHLEMGKAPLTAAIDGTREIAFTIVSMTISLIAVFIPILLLGGIVGRLFREFAVTVSVAIVMSGIISLTVTPMMCAWFIRHDRHARHGALYHIFETIFDTGARFYEWTLDMVLARRGITLLVMLVMLGTLCATVWLYIIVPKGFFPQQDTGLILAITRANADVSYDAMAERIQRLGHIVMRDPDVDNVYYWIGANPTISEGRMNINLKRFDQRKATAAQVLARLKKSLASVQGITPFLQIKQDIQVGGRISATQYQYTLQDADVGELSQWAELLLNKFSAMPQLRDVASDAQAAAASATLRIDRDTASRFGITAQDIDDALYDAFGQRQVATLFTQLNQYHVVLEASARFQLSSEALKHIYIRSPQSGQLVALSLLAGVQNDVSPMSINHQGLFPAITLSFNLAQGVALGDAVAAIQALETQVRKPATVITTFQGTAQAFQSSLKSQPWLILAAIVVIYIVLGVLYEHAIHPLTILSTLPSAGVGALLALIFFGFDLSIMGMVGIVLLIGIVKKNAIMMIDFALAAERDDGVAAEVAIRRGCLLRFRPIMMTTMAALFGAIPLAIGSGAGGELRQPLGIAITGGLLVSQVLTLYTTPVIYIWFDRLRQTMRAARPEKREQIAEV